MAYGDSYYSWVNSGSTAASADTAHHIMGDASGGLSKFHANTVLNIQIQASGADFMLLPTDEASGVQDGIWFKQDVSTYIDLPPIRVSLASQLHFRNLVAGDNAVVRWMVWDRRG